MKRSALGCLAILVLSPSLHAEGFNYNFIEARYAISDIEVSGFSIDGKGYLIGGSFALTDHVALTVGYDSFSYDFDLDSSGTTIGLDLHTPISSTTDFVFGFGAAREEISHPFLGSEDDTGSVISASIRHKIGPTAELDLGVSRVDIFDEDDIGVGIAVLVEVSSNVFFGVGFGTIADTDTIDFGVRAGF